MYIYDGGVLSVAGSGGYLGRYAKNTGYLYIRGGTARLTRSSGATLNVGYSGSGTCEVSSGGLLDVQAGSVRVLPVSVQTGRTGALSVLSGGTVKARSIYSDCTNDTATLVLDSANLVANPSASARYIYGFTSASVGVGGVVVDTAGQDIRFEQSFAARSGQAEPSASTAAELAALPAFTKTGEGVLTLTGTNEWLCATCVSNGTLAVGERALPATTLRLGGGVIDLGGNSFTVENLIGSGVVSNGSLTVTGTVWPGVGDSGVLQVDSSAELAFSRIGCCVAPDGTCGRLKVQGALDLSGVVVVGEGLGNLRDGMGRTLVEADSISGVPGTDGLGDAKVSVWGGHLVVRVSGIMVLIM